LDVLAAFAALLLAALLADAPFAAFAAFRALPVVADALLLAELFAASLSELEELRPEAELADFEVPFDALAAFALLDAAFWLASWLAA